MTPEEIAAIRARITEIDTILQSGASSVTVDGTTTSYSLRDLRAERADLERSINAGTTRRRPFVYKPRLG